MKRKTAVRVTVLIWMKPLTRQKKSKNLLTIRRPEGLLKYRLVFISLVRTPTLKQLLDMVTVILP